ncbi:hypothetical protein PDE_06236 [Penicillium oxalicum 114-2]|uniref:Uncharacterized protein n=1 Tax=Penicillium oxalicum (strain 114-2 / CGMCC 5302) TaxID=933388 RepID=S7ZRJ7_PENO1|nr:hypothetical protein PDE_06236 [Penicillium oxalicum 114-2]
MEEMNQRMKNLDEKFEMLERKVIKQEAELDAHENSRFMRQNSGKKEASRRKNDQLPREDQPLYDSDICTDAELITECYEQDSISWQAFDILYGLTPNEFLGIDQSKCHFSLLVLNEAAAILFRKARTELPTERMRRKRDGIVKLLRERNYEEAEKMSSTCFWKREFCL